MEERDSKENRDHQLYNLSEQVSSLQRKVDQLTTRLEALEGGVEVPKKVVLKASAALQPVAQEDVLTKVDRGALFPRIAAVCFMLVVALILRTVTDNQIVDIKIGSILGMIYAVALITSGFWLYKKQSRLAPVFPGCGLVLFFSIVLETHSRYESLSTVWAYILLFAAGIISVAISFRYHATFLLCLGVLGTLLVGMAIDFPYPVYPFLGVILVAGTIASFLAHRRQMCNFLRYVTLIFAMLFWLFWAFKLTVPAACDEPLAKLLHLTWYYPLLFLFLGVYFLVVVLNVFRKEMQLGFYEGIIPTISAVGAFYAGWLVAIPWYGKGELFGYISLVLSICYFAMGWKLASHDKTGAVGSNSFVFAGICLMVMGSIAILENILFVLPIWSGIAYILCLLSYKWHSGGVRVSSYLLQIFICLYAIASGAFTVGTSSPLMAGMAAAVISGLNLAQFRWSRINKPFTDKSAYFSWLDKKDVSAVVLLVAGLISGYYFLQFEIYWILSRTFKDFAYILQSGQSLCINLGAVFLMLAALKRKSTEIIVLAGLVAIVGAVKVFIFDMFGIKGLPLVASVFSFGIVAAVASLVMGRWQKEPVS